MDRSNRRNLLHFARDDGARAKVALLRSFEEDPPDLDSSAADVPDPWGLPAEAYTEMFDVLEPACAGLVHYVAAARRPS